MKMTIEKAFFNVKYDLFSSVARVEQPYNTLLVRYHDDRDKEHSSFRITSDVEVLRMQQDLILRNPELVTDFFARISPQNPMARYKNDMTDEQLMSFIKSRRFQTPTELERYTEYLLDATESENANFREQVEQYLSSINKEEPAPTSPEQSGSSD